MHEDVITVLNVINAHFSPLEVVIVLMALKIWNKENLIDVETKLTPLLRRFCTWKKQNFDHLVRHDVGHLFVNYPYGISTGMAYVGGICHSGFNCGIESFRGLSATSFAQTVSHELGHNLGMFHDESKNTCTCGRKSCIMYPMKGDSVTFSNCSFDRYFQTTYIKACLYDSPNTQDIVTLTKCGNGVVENREDCDCGTLQLCLKDPCCQDNCALKPNADCARGLCCKNCHFVSSSQCVEQNTMNVTFRSGAMAIQVNVLTMCTCLMVGPAVTVGTAMGRNVLTVQYSVRRFLARKLRMPPKVAIWK